MRIEREGKILRVILSERNLKALLSKLEMEGSLRTIFQEGVFVSSEKDEEHYGERVPGEMHPLTEFMLLEGKKGTSS